MIDLPTMAEFHFLASLSRKDPHSFVDAHPEIRKVQEVYNLLKIHYFIHTTGECWREDVVASMNDNPKWPRVVGYTNYFLKANNLIRIIDRNKVRGERYEITNKGMYMLEQYMVWLREEEKSIFYKIKLMRKNAKELEENT